MGILVRSSLRAVQLLGCAALLVNACARSDTDDGTTGQVALGAPAPPYKAVSLEGDSVSLTALRGRPVLLNVWATWCHPCRDEIPYLRVLHERYRARGLELVGVSVDAEGSEGAIRDFMKEFAMTYSIWRDPDERVSARFLVIGVPATFLVDRDGVLRYRKTGPVQADDTLLTAAIERALGS